MTPKEAADILRRAGMEVTEPTASDLPRPLDGEVWAALEMQPGFSEALRKGERDIAEGRGTPFREIKR